MTPRTRHAEYTTRAAADLSRVTDTANIGKNSKHLMHSLQPNKRNATSDEFSPFFSNSTFANICPNSSIIFGARVMKLLGSETRFMT